MRNILKLFYTFILFLSITSSISYSNASNQPPKDFADIVEALIPTVVNISTTHKSISREKILSKQFNPHDSLSELMERFGFSLPSGELEEEHRRNKSVSLGSGFIIDSSGYIATHNHVISGAEEIIVKLSNDQEYKAKVIGTDLKTDLALLKIEANYQLPTVKFGNSEKVRVGEWVIAIGNPFGLGGTVTVGIISARSRDINVGGIVDNFIQTDAAINKGNSGGPMFNDKGEVIGMNTAIATPSLGNVGIGFATPASLAKPFLEQLKQQGKVQRAWLGVTIQPIDDEIVESLALENNKGALVIEIIRNSPAYFADIRNGDIIISVNNKEIINERKLSRIIAELPIGKEVDVTILRRGNKKTIKVKLGEFKEPLLANNQEQQELKESQATDTKELYGLVLATVTDSIRKKYNLDSDIKGAIVIKLNKSNTWSKRAIQIGDVIVGVNQEKTTSSDEIEKLVKLAAKEKRKSILLLINRDGQLLFIPFSIKS